jgi:hypothetical protein
MKRGQVEHNVGDLVDNGEALPFARVSAIDEETVPASDHRRLTRFLVIEIVDHHALRLDNPQVPIQVYGDGIDSRLSDKLASPHHY